MKNLLELPFPVMVLFLGNIIISEAAPSSPELYYSGQSSNNYNGYSNYNNGYYSYNNDPGEISYSDNSGYHNVAEAQEDTKCSR